MQGAQKALKKFATGARGFLAGYGELPFGRGQPTLQVPPGKFLERFLGALRGAQKNEYIGPIFKALYRAFIKKYSKFLELFLGALQGAQVQFFY